MTAPAAVLNPLLLTPNDQENQTMKAALSRHQAGWQTRSPRTMAALLSMLVLAACGGGPLGEENADEAAGGTAARPAALRPLLDDEGGLMPSDPFAEPADPGARTRAQRYASTEQAAQPSAALVPVLVRGADLRLAATVADRLAEEGMPAVLLVTR